MTCYGIPHVIVLTDGVEHSVTCPCGNKLSGWILEITMLNIWKRAVVWWEICLEYGSRNVCYYWREVPLKFVVGCKVGDTKARTLSFYLTLELSPVLSMSNRVFTFWTNINRRHEAKKISFAIFNNSQCPVTHTFHAFVIFGIKFLSISTFEPGRNAGLEHCRLYPNLFSHVQPRLQLCKSWFDNW